MFESRKIIISTILFVIVTLLLLFSSLLQNINSEFAYIGFIILLAFLGLYCKVITKKTLFLGASMMALALIGGYFISNH